MSGVSVSTGLLLSVFLLLNQCGGRATDDVASGGAGGTAGRSAHFDDCAGAPTEEGGCAGEDGELAPYARLRTSCSHNTHVNRDAGPIPIDCQIR